MVNFPTFHAAMDAAQHIVELGPSAVELVDRTMIDLAPRQSGIPRRRSSAALIGEPSAILLVEFCGEDQAALTREARRDLVALMGDLGLAGQRGAMLADAARKRICGRCARPASTS